MMADTDEKINECIEKSLNYLSAIGRPIDLKYEQRISIQHLLLGKDVIAILPTGIGKCTIFTVYALTKVSWELFCSPWQKNTKQLLNWHLLLHCKPAKSIVKNSRSHWFSKANTLVWAEPCARWAELKMLSFWAGGISSFPPCAHEYRLLRRLIRIKWMPRTFPRCMRRRLFIYYLTQKSLHDSMIYQTIQKKWII